MFCNVLKMFLLLLCMNLFLLGCYVCFFRYENFVVAYLHCFVVNCIFLQLWMMGIRQGN